MELKIIKHQRGYLLIVATIAIVIIGFVASILAYMYLTTTRSTTNILQADQALYIAKAGLEIARRNLLKSGSTLTCDDINISNACYPPGSANCTGYFSVIGEENNVTPSPTLGYAIDSSATTINLDSTTNLLSKGIVVIENEAIWYSNILGTQLLNVKRGILSTTAVSHVQSSQVTQNVCTITATASVKNLNNPEGKRIIKEMLYKTTSGGGVGSLPNDMTPALVSAGNVNLTGPSTCVHNNTVTFESENFAYSTIVSGSSVNGVTLNNLAHTRVGEDDIVSSSSNPGGGHTLRADIGYGEAVPGITSSLLWGYFFTKTKSEVRDDPSTTIVNSSNCNNGTFTQTYPPGKILWVTQNCNFNPQGTIGSTTNPVIIIIEGNVNASGRTAIINGLLYAIIGLGINNSSYTINGMAVAEGAINLNGSDIHIHYDPNILSGLGLLESKYNHNYFTWEEFN
ncbi:MAG: hypothetical protein LBL17_01375 [Coxiellaceae bacterium]|jgi:Tfp pilus assembly protein PilX|nr:hypothetical protein [Coxiellaceae bacterium]